MIFICIGLILLLVLFLYSACRVSSICSRSEELLELKEFKNNYSENMMFGELVSIFLNKIKEVI